MTKVYLLDSLSCYAGEAEVDPTKALPPCTLTPPPDVTAPAVAQFSGNAWVVLDKYPEPPAADVQSEIIKATQQRLDTFAQTRNYDNMLSACTYAASTVTKFKAEGQYCVQSRDATWAKLLKILDEVSAGTRPMPSGYSDIEGDLPVLQWPDAP